MRSINLFWTKGFQAFIGIRQLSFLHTTLSFIFEFFLLVFQNVHINFCIYFWLIKKCNIVKISRIKISEFMLLTKSSIGFGTRRQWRKPQRILDANSLTSNFLSANRLRTKLITRLDQFSLLAIILALLRANTLRNSNTQSLAFHDAELAA